MPANIKAMRHQSINLDQPATHCGSGRTSGGALENYVKGQIMFFVNVLSEILEGVVEMGEGIV